MLISFSVENYLSFKDKVSFSMVASREKQHGGRVPKIKGYMRLLPIAAIYGGNASGKTNFFKAINFARHVVVQGSQPDARIQVEPFKLDESCLKRPATFVFEFLADGKCYEFGFSVTSQQVVEEWLIEVLKTTEKELYRRQNGKIIFGSSLHKNEALRFLFQGTRDNQLFLTNAVSQKNEQFKPLYLWFRDVLVPIAPDSRFEPFDQFLQQDSPLYDFINDALSRMDTGVSKLGGEEIAFENLPAHVDILNRIKEDLGDNMNLRLRLDPAGDRFVISRKDGDITAKKLVSYHVDSHQKEIKFDLKNESDGTLRMIDLLPAFMAIAQPDVSKVYIIDELDRSLHTLLTRQLLESYLAGCSEESRSQLLFTTHDALLMDQDLLRRDEMWVAERGPDGCSDLIAFSDYKDVRNDKDIRKSYLQGRLGGVPKILFKGPFRKQSEKQKQVGE
ncbi:MAG: ATP/GTP-binding protein [Desulfobulbaceae bacterium]|jgi:AAA15 family ATPase/GTPase|nr:ATP/GTP-binding protein [Desulfobulbaceae bacterium]